MGLRIEGYAKYLKKKYRRYLSLYICSAMDVDMSLPTTSVDSDAIYLLISTTRQQPNALR